MSDAERLARLAKICRRLELNFEKFAASTEAVIRSQEALLKADADLIEGLKRALFEMEAENVELRLRLAEAADG